MIRSVSVYDKMSYEFIMKILSATGDLINSQNSFLPFFVENRFLSVSKMFIASHIRRKKIIYAYHMMSMIH